MPSVIINGERFKSVLDEKGRHRFPGNRIVGFLLDNARNGKQIDLNAIWVMYERACFSKAEMHEFYRLIGYSVDGFAEIFQNDDVRSTRRKSEAGKRPGARMPK